MRRGRAKRNVSNWQISLERKAKEEDRSSNWHFVLTPFTSKLLVPEKKATPATENTERGQKPQNRFGNKLFQFQNDIASEKLYKMLMIAGNYSPIAVGARKDLRVGVEASAKFSNPAPPVTFTSKLDKQHFTATAAKILSTKKKKSQRAARKSIEISFINIGQLFL